MKAKKTFQDILVDSTKRFSKKVALTMINDSIKVNYKEFGQLSVLLCDRIKALGAKAGDKVAILSENRPEWGISYFSITSSGFVVVPILPDFHPNQISSILKHSECKVLIVSDKHASRIKDFDGQIIEMESIASLASREEAKKYDYQNLRQYFPKLEENNLASIIYTSGSTGTSKGVMLSHKNIISNIYASKSIIDIKSWDRFLSILPLAHTYECTIAFINSILCGSTTWYLDRPPVASVLMPAMKKVRPTIMLTVPLIMEKVYRSSVLPTLQKMKAWKHENLHSFLEFLSGIKIKKTFGGKIRFFGIGGSALAPDVETFLSHARFPYAIGYGLTETSPLLAGCPPFKTFIRSTGPALKGVQLRISDIRNSKGEGELLVKGSNVMLGYYKNQELTDESFTEDGWFKTGDLCSFDKKGRLFLHGRTKTMILGASGENIYPEEIEATINKNPVVAESLVIKDGNGLTALIKLSEDVLKKLQEIAKGSIEVLDKQTKNILESVRKEVNNNLAKFNKITKVELRKEPFEKTPTLKIKRFLYTFNKEQNA